MKIGRGDAWPRAREIGCVKSFFLVVTPERKEKRRVLTLTGSGSSVIPCRWEFLTGRGAVVFGVGL